MEVQRLLSIFLLALVAVISACNNANYQEGTISIIDPPVYIIDMPFEVTQPPIVDNQTSDPDIPLFNEYSITLDFDPETRMITGMGIVRYTNRTNTNLRELVFRVNLNAWNEEATIAPYSREVYRQIFRDGRNYGYMNILHVFHDNEELSFSLRDTVLTVTLPYTLEQEETTQINIQFEAYIPIIAHRTGANDHAVWAGAFLPVEAVFGSQGWHTEPYYPIGTPFILEAANYVVEIITPPDYTVAGTGSKIESTLDDRKITRFTVQMAARDFAFAISPNFRRTSQITPSGVEISLYYYTNDLPVNHILNTAVETMTFFEETVGRYPYSHLSIVETDMFQNSVGFSAIIFADSNHLRHTNLRDLRGEIGRQWFSSIIGGNPINEAWLSGGLTFLLRDGLLGQTQELRTLIENVHLDLQNRLIRNEGSRRIASSVRYYNTWGDYFRIQHNKAGVMFYSLYREMGEENFRELLREYYNQFAFRIASSADFISLAGDIHGRDLDSFFEYWLYTTELPELPIARPQN